MKSMTNQPASAAPTERKTGILLCAATHWEAAPAARQLGLIKTGNNIYEGIFAGQAVTLIATGIGRDRLLKELSNYKPAAGGTRQRPACCFSIGFAGSLSKNALPGDIVADLHGTDAEWVTAAREAANVLSLPLHFGRIAGAEKVLSSGEKMSLGKTARACAVDMESTVLRDWAARHGAEFAALRVIYDGLSESLPKDLPSGGEFSETCLWALRRPGRWIQLARMGYRSRRCSIRLSRYLAEFLRRI